MRLANVKIGTKLIGAFVLVAMLVLVAGVVGILMIGTLASEMDIILIYSFLKR